MSFAAPAELAHAPARVAWSRWESIAGSLCLAQFTEPFFAAVAQSQGLTEPPGYARIFFIPVYAFLAFVLWRDRALAGRTMRAVPLLMSLLALVVVSATWSIDTGGTLRRAVWLAATMSFAMYLAWRSTWRELLTVIGGAFIVLIVGSLALSTLAPNIGRMTTEHVGAWSGLWTHKNTLGGIMALGVAVCVSAAHVDKQRRLTWFTAACGAFALVLLSTSKTALLATFLQLAIIALGIIVRRGPVQAVIASAGVAVGVIVIAGLALLAPDVLVGIIGRDLTLTGRTDIWHAAAPAVAAHPWFGYGYYVFWTPENGPAYWVRQAVAWQVQSAHSSWLELALGLGRVGVVLFALQLIATLRRGASAIGDAQAGFWAPGFLAAFALYTLSESHALQANNMFWAIYVAVAAKLALDARARKSA